MTFVSGSTVSVTSIEPTIYLKMARRIYVAGILTMAAACGVIGYQVLTLYFYREWPAVSFEFFVVKLAGEYPELEWPWANRLLRGLGQLPLSLFGFLVSYSLLLISDMLRGDARRRG
jgi:hypothetical protein